MSLLEVVDIVVPEIAWSCWQPKEATNYHGDLLVRVPHHHHRLPRSIHFDREVASKSLLPHALDRNLQSWSPSHYCWQKQHCPRAIPCLFLLAPTKDV